MSVPRPRLPSQTSQVLLCVLALTKTLQILHLQNLPRIDNRVQSQGISPSSSNASIEYPLTSIRYPEINHATSSPHTHNDTDRQRERDRQTETERQGERAKERETDAETETKQEYQRDKQKQKRQRIEETVDKEVSD